MTSDVSACRELVTDDPAIDGAEDAASAATIAIAAAIASTVATAAAANHDATATTAPATDTSSAATATASAAAARGSLRTGSYHHQRCRADEAETINAGQDHPGDQPRQDAATTGWIIGHEVSLL
jgi:hypothetical protein